jgi:MFS family permease
VSGPQRILVLARTVSILGDFAAPVALSFAVLALSPGPEAVPRLALVLAAAAVPQLLFLAAGGAAADRGHRRLLAVGGETGAALAEAASAALLLTHTATPGALAGLAAARGASSAAGTPAMRALVADLADHTDQIASVSAALSGGRAIATMTGPALGGLLVTSAGPGWALAANAASYALAAVLLSSLRPPVGPAQPAGSQPANVRQLRNGWHTIASQQLGTVAAADEACGAVANPLAIAVTAPLIALLGARTIMAGGLLWLAVSTTALTALTAIRGPGFT